MTMDWRIHGESPTLLPDAELDFAQVSIQAERLGSASCNPSVTEIGCNSVGTFEELLPPLCVTWHPSLRQQLTPREIGSSRKEFGLDPREKDEDWAKYASASSYRPRTVARPPR